MGLFDKFFKPKKAAEPEVAPTPPKPKAPDKSAKQLATETNEPYVNILSLDVDLDNLQLFTNLTDASPCNTYVS